MLASTARLSGQSLIGFRDGAGVREVGFLSISEEQAFPSLRFSPVVGGRVLEMLGSRVSISQ